jgi:hypothetical protein
MTINTQTSRKLLRKNTLFIIINMWLNDNDWQMKAQKNVLTQNSPEPQSLVECFLIQAKIAARKEAIS